MAKKTLKKFADIKDKLKTATFNNNTIGADPELFVKRSGRVVGSEKVIKETSTVVEDGVQVELHPSPNTCRERLAISLQQCMLDLQQMLTGKRCSTTDEVTVDVTKAQYDSLSDKNKEFGCGQSFNVHDNTVTIMEVDPSVYLKRSAGGHIHLGRSYATEAEAKAIDDPYRLVPVLDILVGNTCVLLDRDEGNVERRKHYGRAGEYRTPPHGLEYRTLSNFWLRGEALMSLVFGLARHSIGVVATKQDKYLHQIVDMEDVIKAINNNDYDLAKRNWNKYKGFIVATARRNSNLYPIRSNADVERFEHVAKVGLDKWFDRDLIKAWVRPQFKRGGWGSFNQHLTEQIKAENKAKKT